MKDGKEELRKQATETKLEIKNSNHILFKYDKLSFEILGGINHENYHSLWVMLVTNHNNRTICRENVDLLNHDQRIAYIIKVAEKTQIHRDKVSLAFESLIDELSEYKLELQNNYGKPVVKSYQLSDTDREQAIETLKQPNLLTVINSMIDSTGVIGNDSNRMILFLTYLTRKTNTSLHAVIQSQYNYLQNKMSLLIPDEEKYVISHISDNALFYFTEHELQNKIILVEDTTTNRKSLLPLIGFQTNNLVTKTTVSKNEYAELVTKQKQVRGNVSLSISTREEQAFTQNGALSFVINEDTGSIQDEKILLYQRKQSAGIIRDYNEQKVIKQIQNLQRVLSNVAVINPFAMLISLPEQIKNKQITNLHYLRFVEVITLLKQHQRTRKVDLETGEEYIETTLEDIREANQLLAEILVNKSDVLNKPTRLHLEQLKTALATGKIINQAFTLNEVSIALHVPKTTVTRYNKILIDTGFVIATGEGDRNNGYQYQLVNTEEYNELKTSINKVMSNNIISIEQSVSEPKTTANQNESGAPNVLKNNTIDEVNHKTEIGTQETTTKSINPKKNVA
jgi:predicted transcriptional regulator